MMARNRLCCLASQLWVWTSYSYAFNQAATLAFHTSANYTYNGENDRKYHFGNDFNLSAAMSQNVNTWFSWSAGLRYRIAQADQQAGFDIPNTGGDWLDFWASWCPPCLESLPAYDRMRQEIGTEEFQIIAINVDENTADGLKFLEQRPVSYPVLADPAGEIGIPWGIGALPRSFLIDREGRIVVIRKRFRSGDEIKLKRSITDLLAQ